MLAFFVVHREWEKKTKPTNVLLMLMCVCKRFYCGFSNLFFFVYWLRVTVAFATCWQIFIHGFRWYFFFYFTVSLWTVLYCFQFWSCPFVCCVWIWFENLRKEKTNTFECWPSELLWFKIGSWAWRSYIQRKKFELKLILCAHYIELFCYWIEGKTKYITKLTNIILWNYSCNYMIAIYK